MRAKVWHLSIFHRDWTILWQSALLFWCQNGKCLQLVVFKVAVRRFISYSISWHVVRRVSNQSQVFNALTLISAGINAKAMSWKRNHQGRIFTAWRTPVWNVPESHDTVDKHPIAMPCLNYYADAVIHGRYTFSLYTDSCKPHHCRK